MAEQNETAKRIAGRVLQRILDFDDRTSPEDEPDMLLVTGQELTDLIEEEISEALATPVSEAGGEAVQSECGFPFCSCAKRGVCAHPKEGQTNG